MLTHTRSETLFNEAQSYIPGGVNSPVRAFNGVGGTPIFIKRAEGAYLIDEDDNRYIDYIGSWGPMILGHAHPAIVNAVKAAAENGTSYGAPTRTEVELAKLICKIMPSIEQIRFVNSGTEATMSAIRLARGFTARNKIIKFAGCYHGHADMLLANAGSGALTLGVPNSAGVPEDLTKHTLIATYNNLDSVQKLFEIYPTDIAGIIVEPVAGNMNCVLPRPEFLTGLRELCTQYESLLIIDEVMTGFRVSLGGAQEYYKVTPDITTLGKVIGGGLPVGAFGGRKEIMDFIAPSGPVYQAGTLSGNPLAMAAGLANLIEIMQPDFHKRLSAITQQLIEGLEQRAQAAKIPFTTQYLGGMFGIFFTDNKHVYTLDDVKKCNIPQFKQFFHLMLEQGCYFAPSAYEAGFISIAHTQTEINQTLKAAEIAFAKLAI